jgi:hypothetical protein
VNYNPVQSLLGSAAVTTGATPLPSNRSARGVAAVLGAVRSGLSFGGGTTGSAR